MDGRPIDWLPDSFSRSPAWRMLRAAHRLREKGPPDPQLDDEWVETAIRLIRSPGESDRSDSAGAAHRLWVEDRESRWLLEAQLLTSRTPRDVGATCGLAEPVVEAYHQLFFDVRTRLHASDWVLTLAVRSSPMNDFAGPQPAGIWKYTGFMGGPLVLDAVVAVTTGRELPDWLRDTFVTNRPFEEQRFRLKTKLAVAALTSKSAHQIGSLLELSEQLHDLEAGAGLSVGEEESLMPVVGDLLAAMGRLAPAEPKAAACSAASHKPTPPGTANAPVRATASNGGKRRE